MTNFGNMSIADLRLGATQVKAAYLGSVQIWGISPVVSNYDIQSIGRSTSEQGTSIEITEQAGDTITLYIKTNAIDVTGKQVCAAVYLNSTDVTPYASFAFSNVSLADGYITGTTPDVSTWVPSGFPDTYSTLYMKTWIQDAGYIDPASALGEVLDWTGEEPAPAADWLCFTAEQANSTVQLNKSGSPAVISLETSTDGTTWTDYSWTDKTGDTLTLANVGDKVYMRAKTENSTIGSSNSACYQFNMTGRIAASGNIQTLLKSSGDVYVAPSFCYRNIFKSCTSLTTAPKLPATTLLDHCYLDAFNGCTSLITAPALPATALATYCYQGTFSGCTSLTTVPELPATTLATYCYCWMFGNCTSLTEAPKLQATTLAYGCFENMFNGCSSLSSIEVAFSTWGSGNTNWVKNVAASGTFKCPFALPDVRGTANIPVGWKTSFVDGPLTFTAQEANCTVRLDKIGNPGTISLEYSTDRSTWTDYTWSDRTGDTITLAAADDRVFMRAKTENDHIAANSANSNRYNFVTSGRIAASGNIQSLLKADCSRTDVGSSGEGFRRLFSDTTITEAPELPATTLRSHCYEDMFKYCYSLTAAPKVLPAVTTTTDAYRGMFSGCSALTDSPMISAVVSPSFTDMGWMFENCTSLSSICICLSAWNSYGNNSWVSNVKSSGTFTCPSTLPDQRGASYIPNNWTKVDL